MAASHWRDISSNSRQAVDEHLQHAGVDQDRAGEDEADINLRNTHEFARSVVARKTVSCSFFLAAESIYRPSGSSDIFYVWRVGVEETPAIPQDTHKSLWPVT